MSIYPLFYLLVVTSGWLVAFWRGPIWALVVYVFIYFNIPAHQWWGSQVPDLRWSLLAAAVLLTSCMMHGDKLTPRSSSQNLPGVFLLLLLVWMMAISPFGPDPGRSWNKVYDFFRYVLIFFLINRVIRDFTKYRLFVAMLLVCTFYLSVLAHHYFSGSRLDGVGLPDASDANMLAALVLLVLPLYVAMFVTEQKWLRLLPLAAMVMVLNMFVMCGSRGAFLGLIVQGGMALPILRRQVGLFRALACCLIVVACLFRLMSDQYKDRLLGLEQGLQNESGEMGAVSAGRTEIWKYGLLMVRDYPLGAGGGAFRGLSPLYIPGSLLTGGERASHNTYLLVLVEQGGVGLIIYFGFIFALFRILFRAIKQARGKELSATQQKVLYHANAVAIGLAGFWTASFFIDRLYFEGIYLISALVPVLVRLLENPEAENNM